MVSFKVLLKKTLEFLVSFLCAMCISEGVVLVMFLSAFVGALQFCLCTMHAYPLSALHSNMRCTNLLSTLESDWDSSRRVIWYCLYWSYWHSPKLSWLEHENAQRVSIDGVKTIYYNIYHTNLLHNFLIFWRSLLGNTSVQEALLETAGQWGRLRWLGLWWVLIKRSDTFASHVCMYLLLSTSWTSIQSSKGSRTYTSSLKVSGFFCILMQNLCTHSCEWLLLGPCKEQLYEYEEAWVVISHQVVMWQWMMEQGVFLVSCGWTTQHSPLQVPSKG